ncbi:winged helix-turn-helix domain-containing protein [Streptomyces sp. NPDC059909]|uniref:winged helix-turn-helix domain-containing protein n=1 Tax=Streptomyces sp. NPDC059909 TaxID=3346998 RepID=UPI00364ACDF5
MEGEQSSGDGGGREFQRVAGALRTAMTDGTYERGVRLPAQRDLAKQFGVSRDTIQRVLKDLADEGWIESRQGSGSVVRKTQQVHSPVGNGAHIGRRITLGPLVAAAFNAPEVTLDVFTLTSESLDAHIRLQAERVINEEIKPRRIALRLLLPAETSRLAYPRNQQRPDDPRPLERLNEISRRHTESLRAALETLRDGYVPEVSVEIKHAPLTPNTKLYLLNGVEALHGFYELIERQVTLAGGQEETILDVVGLGATMFHFVKDDDPESQGSLFVDAAQAWFDSQWRLLAE